MFFVGIDVASRKHDAAITSNYGEVITEPFTIENNLEGFKKLREEILSHTESLDEVCIGIEETGIYSKNICEYLALCDFTVYMINPILTSNSRKSQSVRITKTDSIDALAICRYVEFNFKRLNPYTPSLYLIEELKSLSRARLDIQSRLIKAKTEWTRLLDITFPEFRMAFNQHSKWAYQLFKQNPTPDKIARMHIKSLVDIIKVHANRDDAASKIKSIAKNSIGQSSRINAILIQNTLDDIFHYNSQMNLIGGEIESIVSDNFKNILTIPGIGPITAGIIIGEIGDIHRFKSPAALLAYSGLDPIVHQSGLFKAQNVSISKRGSTVLRSAIFTSTKIACINPNINFNKFRAKYQLKMSQGKHHNSSICHATKNMINTIFALLHSGESFNYNQ